MPLIQKLARIWPDLVVLAIFIAIIGGIASGVYLFFTRWNMADAEWAASGYAERARADAKKLLDDYIRQSISSSVSASTGTFLLEPQLEYSTGKTQYLLEQGYWSIVIRGSDSKGSIPLVAAEDTAMKTFVRLHPDLLLEEHVGKCGWGNCTIKMSYRPR